MKTNTKALWQPAGMPGIGDHVKLKGAEVYGDIVKLEFANGKTLALIKLKGRDRRIRWELEKLEFAA
jgi:hypothetical protein